MSARFTTWLSVSSAGFEPAISGWKDRRPLRRHHEDVERVGQESNLHSRKADVLQTHEVSSAPNRHVSAVPWRGLEPLISTVRTWRPLRLVRQGSRQWPRGELNPQHTSF